MGSSARFGPRLLAVAAMLAVWCMWPTPSLKGQEGGQPPPAEPAPAEAPDANLPENPFPHRIPAPGLEGGIAWLNAEGEISLEQLKGKFVLLDFWTYCCINCMHILPELKKLEEAYPNELVVIGVHSAKFEGEEDTDNIREAVLRYEIAHPVVNDAEHTIWNRYGIRSWPTMVLIDPDGLACYARSGEFTFEQMDAILQAALPHYKAKGSLNTTPIRFPLERDKVERRPLAFPGKVLADEASDRLFIADSNHHRIVIARLDGTLIDIVGAGRSGANDGEYAAASFKQPQGMTLHEGMLYVADTENHLLRRVDLKARRVTTIAGTGVQGRNPWPGLEEQLENESTAPARYVGPPMKTAINSPWALHVHQGALYIAMAGPHQIWKMPLDGSEIGPYAGNALEDIVDGPLLPDEPYAEGSSSFAQPSGLASDGAWLYVADSEGSSIRAVPFDPEGKVRTIVGTSHLPYGRLFDFGDVDGELFDVRLQHVLGVTYYDGMLYIADTYNNKIKRIDPHSTRTRTIAGDGQPGDRDGELGGDKPARFDEPAGISSAAGKLYVADTNNHAIRVIDLSGEGYTVSTLEIKGLEPPKGE